MAKRNSQRRSRRYGSGKERVHKAIAQRVIRGLLVGLGCLLAGWLVINGLRLQAAAAKPVDAFLVLGGSITREIHAAELAKHYPQTPILISKGSEDPCIKLIFQRANAPMDQVWLERCADSTFGNFFYAIPILQQWHVRKVKVVTSASHLPRAIWLGQILLGAHGIWVEPEIVAEKTGIPGNQESWLKTGADLGRSLAWAVGSQLYQAHCDRVGLLTEVDLAEWKQHQFNCEHQGHLGV
jgi:uncharacterized SAM-binding protein YcdF (DUF218 family)